MAFAKAKMFVKETDGHDAAEAVAKVLEDLGIACDNGPDAVLMMRKTPEPGEVDNTRRNTVKALRFAADLKYEMPSHADAEGTWDLFGGATMTEPSSGIPFCVAIDCGIPEWEVTTYRRLPHTKATSRFHLRYVVEADGTDIADFEKISEAKAFAKQVMTTPSTGGLDAFPTEISINRKPVSNGGNDLAVGYRRQVRKTKTCPSKVQKGAQVAAIHHWLVYGNIMGS
jgi:hypothetical protein